MDLNLSYFSLMEKVGDKGRYQWMIFVLSCLIWILYGTSTFSLAFIFLNPGFDCTSLGVTKLECENYVCSHFTSAERSQYEAGKEMESLVTEFGSFHCE